MRLSVFSLVLLIFFCGFQASAQKPSPPDKTSGVQQAKRAYAAGDFKKAEELFWKNIVHLDLMDLKLLMRSAEKNKHYDESLKAAELVLAKNEGDEEALTMIGEFHSRKTSQKDSNQLAIDHFKKAIESNSKYQPAYEALIRHYEARIDHLDKLKQDKQKNYYELRILYQDMLKVFGERADHLSALCRINTLDAQLDQAQEVCLKAIEKNKADPQPYVYLGLAFRQAQDADEAKKYLRFASSRFTKSELAQVTWADFLEEQKDYIQAYKHYLDATVINDKSGDAWRGVGRNAIQINKADEAYNAFQKACGYDPKSAAPDLRRALLLVKTDRSRLMRLAESCR